MNDRFMIGLLQRVTNASVEVDSETLGSIQAGLMVLVGMEREDDETLVERLAHRLLHYRVFPDEQGKMNCNVMQVGGGMLLVPQFTLAADTRKGLRPSFNGATPELANQLFDQLVQSVTKLYQPPETGQFAADMQVCLCNDGPVTFWLQVN